MPFIPAASYGVFFKNNVLHAEDPLEAYREAEKSGQMTIDGKTFKSGIKITAALNMGSVINSFIGSLKR